MAEWAEVSAYPASMIAVAAFCRIVLWLEKKLRRHRRPVGLSPLRQCSSTYLGSIQFLVSADSEWEGGGDLTTPSLRCLSFSHA